MKRRKLVIILIITSFLTVISVVLTMQIYQGVERIRPDERLKEKEELSVLDSLLEQRSYYVEQLNLEVDTTFTGTKGYGPRAKYLKKIIRNIEKDIEKIVPNSY